MNIDFGVATKGKVRKPPPPAKLYDLEPVKKRFAVYSIEIDKMVVQAEALKVEDDQSMTQAVGFGTQAKGLFKKIEDERKRIINDPGEFVRAVNRFAKTYQDRLKAIENILKKKIADFSYKKELERREAERKAQEARDELQKKLDEEAEVKGVAPVQVEPQVVPKEETTTRTETGTSHQRMKWEFEVVDFKALVQAVANGDLEIIVLMPNETKLRQMVAMGIRKIPGVKIFEKATTVFRT